MPDPESRQAAEGAPREDAVRAWGARTRELSPKVRTRVVREALASWRAEGLISAEQHDLLLDHTETPLPSRSAEPGEGLAEEGWLARGVAILIHLGAIALAAGLITRYAHCSATVVKEGDVVTRGQEIAKVGTTGRSTGPHLHFEVIRNNQSVNPIAYLDSSSNQLARKTTTRVTAKSN